MTRDPGNSSVVYAAGAHYLTDNYEFVVLKSSDSGATWPVQGTFKPTTFTDNCLIQVAPWDSAQVYAAACYMNEQYDSSIGLYCSKDNLKTWSNLSGSLASLISDNSVSLNAFLLTYDYMAYVGTSDGIYRMRVGNNTWTKAALDEEVTGLAFDSSTGILYASTPDGVFYSADGNTGWKLFGDPGSECTSLELDSAHQYLYVGTDNKAIFRVPLGPLKAGASRAWMQY